MRLSPEILHTALVRRGFSPDAASALVANAEHESGFRTDIPGDNGNAYGLFQWNGPRRQKLYAFASERKAHPSDPNVQLDFLGHEMETSFPGLRAAMNKASAPEGAAMFTRVFERPRDTEGEARRRAVTAGRYRYGEAPKPDEWEALPDDEWEVIADEVSNDDSEWVVEKVPEEKPAGPLAVLAEAQAIPDTPEREANRTAARRALVEGTVAPMARSPVVQGIISGATSLWDTLSTPHQGPIANMPMSRRRR